jgi:hypothetical protein
MKRDLYQRHQMRCHEGRQSLWKTVATLYARTMHVNSERAIYQKILEHTSRIHWKLHNLMFFKLEVSWFLIVVRVISSKIHLLSSSHTILRNYASVTNGCSPLPPSAPVLPTFGCSFSSLAFSTSNAGPSYPIAFSHFGSIFSSAR